MNCETCKESRAQVSHRVHTEDMARLERANRRWFITWLITFTLLVGVVIFLFWRESQFEVVEETVTQDIDTGDGDLTLTGIGDIYYGESKANDQETHTNP